MITIFTASLLVTLSFFKTLFAHRAGQKGSSSSVLEEVKDAKVSMQVLSCCAQSFCCRAQLQKYPSASSFPWCCIAQLYSRPVGFCGRSDILCMAHPRLHKVECKGFQLVCLSKPSPPRYRMVVAHFILFSFSFI